MMRHVPPPTDEITTREALRILGLLDPSSISRYVALGTLKPSRQLPGHTGAMLFWRADIERFAKERAEMRAAKQAAV